MDESESVFEPFLDTPIVFGLRQQGKLETVKQMRRDGFSWDTIGYEIGWTGEAIERFYKIESACEDAGAEPGVSGV